jgi:hypothetical protein
MSISIPLPSLFGEGSGVGYCALGNGIQVIYHDVPNNNLGGYLVVKNIITETKIGYVYSLLVRMR